MTSNTEVLIVEDESSIASNLSHAVAQLGILPTIADDGEIAEKFIRTKHFDCFIFDINLPKKSGIELCKIAKEIYPNVPVLVLTAFGELDDKLDAFNAGADDYLTKPFYIEELLARLKALLKRANKSGNTSEQLTIEDLIIDKKNKEVFRGGKEVNLTNKEFQLLELLANYEGKVVSKQIIAESVWDVNFDTGTNTIEVYINFLRKKVDKNFDKKLIHTKPGYGYYLKASEE
jgi:two-component system, OmpR family, copper resistance phosphate regulon response regulator CusR